MVMRSRRALADRSGWCTEKWIRPDCHLRTELDALPVTENTGLPFASTVGRRATGAEVGSCTVVTTCTCGMAFDGAYHGVDKTQWVALSCWLATAEEVVSGAKAMRTTAVHPISRLISRYSP